MPQRMHRAPLARPALLFTLRNDNIQETVHAPTAMVAVPETTSSVYSQNQLPPLSLPVGGTTRPTSAPVLSNVAPVLVNRNWYRLSVALGEAFNVDIANSLFPDAEGTRSPVPISESLQRPQPAYLPRPALRAAPGVNPAAVFDAASQALRELWRKPQEADAALKSCRRDTRGSRFAEDLGSDNEPEVNADADASGKVDIDEPEQSSESAKKITFVSPPTPQRRSRDFDFHVRPPTPPLHPRHCERVHQQPGHWDKQGAECAIAAWIDDLLNMRDDFKLALETYFTKWSLRLGFKAARQLLAAMLTVCNLLIKLSSELDRLPPALAAAVEQLDMNLRVCMLAAHEVHESMTYQSSSSPHPLTGKNLFWRKFTIKHDLGPRMLDIANNLRLVQKDVEKIRKELAA